MTENVYTKPIQHFFLIAFVIFFCGLKMIAQQNVQSDKTITIIKKSIDAEGNETVEKTTITADKDDHSAIERILEEELGSDYDISFEELDQSSMIKIGDELREMGLMLEDKKILFNDKLLRSKILRDRDQSLHLYAQAENEAIDPKTKDGQKAFLGVYSDGRAEGLQIRNVIPNSAAEEAGLQSDDYILSINGDPLKVRKDLIRAIAAHLPGDKIELSYRRDGVIKTKTITLGGTELTNLDRRSHLNKFPVELAKTLEEQGISEDYFAIIKKDFDIKEKARLGVEIKDSETPLGARVIEVLDGTAADKINLKEGDVITHINDEAVKNTDELIEEIRKYEKGDKVEVKFIRNQDTRNKEATLGSWVNNSWSKGGHFHPIVKDRFMRGIREGGCNSFRGLVKSLDNQKIIIIKDGEEELPKEEPQLSKGKLSGLTIFPNPSKGAFEVFIADLDRADVDIKLLDAGGKEIINVRENNFSGTYQQAFNLFQHPVGNYFLNIVVDGMKYVEQVSIQR